jgi:hypothetical protein
MAYPDLTDIRAYCGLGTADTDDNGLLGTLLADAIAFVEGPAGAGRVFAAASATTRHYDALADVDGRTLYVFDADLAAVTAVVNGDGSTISAGDYVTEPRRDAPYYALTLKASSGLSWTYEDDPEDAIAITGTWAYGTAVPGDIQQAVRRLTAWLYRQKDSSASAGDSIRVTEVGVIIPSAVPKDVMTTLIEYRRRGR